MRPPATVAPGDEGRAETALAHVSSALWRIRELLELLTFKLETEQVLVAAGRTRWLGRATHEVELVLEEIRHAELRRSIGSATSPRPWASTLTAPCATWPPRRPHRGTTC